MANASSSASTSTTIGSVYTRGKVWLGGQNTTLGSNSSPIDLTAANVGYGTATNLPQPCASSDPPITVNGDVYIKGSFYISKGTILRPADGLTQSPKIVVNGNVLVGDAGDGGGVGGGSILPNAGGVPLTIISFGSSDLGAGSCSMSDTCTSPANIN